MYIFIRRTKKSIKHNTSMYVVLFIGKPKPYMNIHVFIEKREQMTQTIQIRGGKQNKSSTSQNINDA